MNRGKASYFKGYYDDTLWTNLLGLSKANAAYRMRPHTAPADLKMHLSQSKTSPESGQRPHGESASSLPHGSATHTRLQPRNGWQPINLTELWRYRELAWFLAVRDIKVRYKQTAFGTAWAVIQPLFSTILFTVFFNKLAGVKLSGTAPYAVSAFCAMLPWQLFETSLTSAGNSLVGSQNLITKVYFPRLTVPIASILSGVLDFAIAFLLLIGMMAWYGVRPTAAIIVLPYFVLLCLLVALAAGLWLSALNVQYRDVRYALPFLARLWFFATPIVYSADSIQQKLGPVWGPRVQALYGLNPMVGVVEGFRWVMLGGDQPPPSLPLLAVSTAATIILLIGGLFYFRRMELTFADVV
ncbi:MAG: Polysaccharide transporter permease protein [Phycisphaerales bacterium]|jgi:lipopolysaccharide transport system permease protein|nr:Polysaccharide transporter permease protein [Phycisphaerales bacterium]